MTAAVPELMQGRLYAGGHVGLRIEAGRNPLATDEGERPDRLGAVSGFDVGT
jgi:hypothetical protein